MLTVYFSNYERKFLAGQVLSTPAEFRKNMELSKYHCKDQKSTKQPAEDKFKIIVLIILLKLNCVKTTIPV